MNASYNSFPCPFIHQRGTHEKGRIRTDPAFDQLIVPGLEGDVSFSVRTETRLSVHRNPPRVDRAFEPALIV